MRLLRFVFALKAAALAVTTDKHQAEAEEVAADYFGGGDGWVPFPSLTTALIDLIERIAWYPCNLASGSRGCSICNCAATRQAGSGGELGMVRSGEASSSVFLLQFFCSSFVDSLPRLQEKKFLSVSPSHSHTRLEQNDSVLVCLFMRSWSGPNIYFLKRAKQFERPA